MLGNVTHGLRLGLSLWKHVNNADWREIWKMNNVEWIHVAKDM
jgi:hypothetical protein